MQIAGPPAPETLRGSQLARRRRIVMAALRALARSDYEDVKITDVARESNVALGTLYRYFASKEHLLAAAFLEWQSALKGKLEKNPPAGTTEAERLHEAFHQVIRAFQRQPQFFRVMTMLQNTSDTYAAEIFTSVESAFREIMETVFDSPFDEEKEAILWTVNAALITALGAWVMNRLAINDVYKRVDEAIRLIYEYRPAAP